MVAAGIPEVEPVVDEVVKELGGNGRMALDAAEVKEAVKAAVKQSVKEAVRSLVESATAEAEEKNVA